MESIIKDENVALTVSSLLQDCYGLSDVYFSVPTIVSRNGVKVLELPFGRKEIKQFQNSASMIKKITQSLDL